MIKWVDCLGVFFMKHEFEKAEIEVIRFEEEDEA